MKFDTTSIKSIQNEYYNEYKLYTKTISSEEMCISENQYGLIAYILRNYNLNNRLDTGSGFSSYVIRKETLDNQIHVSVEDSDIWRQKTTEFFKSHKLDSTNLVSVQEFEKLNYTYDFIFHDMGNMETRRSSLSMILSKLNLNGFIMLDDVHKQSYVEYVKTKMENFLQIDITQLSIDRFGRHAYLYKKIKSE